MAQICAKGAINIQFGPYEDNKCFIHLFENCQCLIIRKSVMENITKDWNETNGWKDRILGGRIAKI